ncbi:MAG: hypothetical protein FWB86_13505 [Treponema sp.]|nr:hypothetical protein [Treponema sp.]
MKRKYVSKIMEAIHEDAFALHKSGIITKKQMQEFDDDCLVKPSKKTAKPIKSRTTALKKKTAVRKRVKTAK